MRLITNTNIIVDDFDYCKNFAKNTFIHFLSHFHADHWFGLTPLWDYSPIYCSSITKKLILNSFPKIQNIFELELNVKHTITLNANPNLKVDVYLFDANHIPGSVMFLFKGYMGTILHTGDFRFKAEMITENPILYPVEKVQASKNYKKCSIHIDELVFDNTYCDPLFKFPTRDIATKQMINIIEKNPGKRVLIAMSALGKEQMLLSLSEYFQTLILVPERKFKQIEAMGLRTDMLTFNEKESWIELVGKKQRMSRLEQEKAAENTNFIMICIDFLMFDGDLSAPDGINYLVPYSQHSNFMELEQFVKSIQPSILKKLVLPYLSFPEFKDRPINNIAAHLSYLKNLQKGGKSAYRHFLNEYTHISELSEEYKKWMTVEMQKELMFNLGIIKNADPSLRKKRKRDSIIANIENQHQGKSWKEVEKTIFHVTGGKKVSLHDRSEHMLAVNTNQSLDSLLIPKTKKLKFSKNKDLSDITNENDFSMTKESYSVSFDKLDSFKKSVIKVNEKETEETKSGKVEPKTDEDLKSLLDTFIGI